MPMCLVQDVTDNTGFEDGERGQEPTCARSVALEAGKGKKMNRIMHFEHQIKGILITQLQRKKEAPRGG